MSNLIVNIAVYRWHIQIGQSGFPWPLVCFNDLVSSAPPLQVFEFRPLAWRPFRRGWLP